MPTIRLPTGSTGVSFSAYQVMSIPTDCTSADFVSETGSSLGTVSVPRVLIPLPIKDGGVDLTGAHRPSRPDTVFGPGKAEPVLIWIDVRSTPQAMVSTWQTTLAVVNTDGDQLGSTPVAITVDDFEMPAKPTVRITAAADWGLLEAAFPDSCQGLTPRLLERGDPRSAPAIAVLDRLVAAAHDNRVSLFVPDVGPVVKWPVDSSPAVDWSMFDSVVEPWFDGSAFADKLPIGFWPMPSALSLGQFDNRSQAQYWQSASVHFGSKNWTDFSPVMVPVDRQDDGVDSAIAAQARSVLAIRPPVRLMVPSTIDRFALETATPGGPTGLAPSSRVIARAAGEIYPSQLIDVQPDPDAVRWLAVHAGLGTEQQIRCAAWLAYLRGASIVKFDTAVDAPDFSNPNRPAGSSWYYSGKSFGIDGPLQTVQLKWARQAEQDYEYLLRTTQRGRGDQARQLCRLLTRTIRLQPTQSVDPEFLAMTGSVEPGLCEQCRRLLVGGDRAGLSTPTAEFSRWVSGHESPTIVPTGVRWQWHRDSPGDVSRPAEPGTWVSAQLTADVYNPGDTSTFENLIAWSTADHGWGIHPQPTAFPTVAGGEVRRVDVTGWYNLEQIDPKNENSIVLNYTDGFTRQTMPVQLYLPVAASDRRTRPVRLDGSLQDWSDEDAINLNRPLVKMLTRSSVQSQTVQPAELPASIYTGWSDENFYVAFRVGGVSTSGGQSFHNDVVYQHGKAWGEDLCELLVQPLYTNDTTGSVIHIVCKPGGVWIERRAGESSTARWVPYESGGIRIDSTIEEKARLWRAELAIPWQAIVPPNRGRPGLLRFNFIQHRNDTGESASWAGPLYQSRQSGFSGLILVRDQTRLAR